MKSKLFKLIFPFVAMASVHAEENQVCQDECVVDAVQDKATPSVEKSSFYGAFNLGPAPVPLPGFTFGYRMQDGHIGTDTALQLTTIGYGSQLKGKQLVVYYFNPNLKSQFYSGLGFSSSAFFVTHHIEKAVWAVSPEWSFGKSYQNAQGEGRFFELQVAFPTHFCGEFHETMYLPLCTLSYGIEF